MPTTKDDLTFSELAAALPAGAVTFAGGDITLSMSAITGDTYTALTDPGVVEGIYKLLRGAATAQVTANDALDPAAGDIELGAFLTSAFSIPDENGNVFVTQRALVSIPLNDATVKGQTV